LAILQSAKRTSQQELPMDAHVRARYEARAKVIKALAHPTRLFMIDQLAHGGERCVCELTEMVGADMSTVSKHLSLLKEAGILADEKRGSQVFYRLRTQCILGFFDCVESMLAGKAEAQQRLFAPEVAAPSEPGELGHRAPPIEMIFSWMAGDAPIMTPPAKTDRAYL
jgi:ArsR family transcriptional regulator